VVIAKFRGRSQYPLESVFQDEWRAPAMQPRIAGGRKLPAASLLASDELEHESTRGKTDHRRHRAIGDARNDHAAALHQAAIAVSRHLLGGAREKSRKGVVAHAGAGLKLRWHRTGAKHGNPHAFRLELAMQRFAEREYIGFAGVIDRHAGTGHEGRN